MEPTSKTFRSIARWADNAADLYADVETDDFDNEAVEHLRRQAVACAHHMFRALLSGSPETTAILMEGYGMAAYRLDR